MQQFLVHETERYYYMVSDDFIFMCKNDEHYSYVAAARDNFSDKKPLWVPYETLRNAFSWCWRRSVETGQPVPEDIIQELYATMLAGGV